MKYKNLKKFVCLCFCLALTILSVGCASGDSDKDEASDNSGKTEKTEYTHRVILMSDVHYVPGVSAAEYNAQYPNANCPPAAGDLFGYTMAEKMSIIMEDINTFMKRDPIDAVLVLGDLSTDDYGYRNMPENYVKKFKEEVMDQFPVESYALAGNHDGYTNDMWKAVFGYDRQYSFKIGDAAFVMMDAYQGGTATGSTGSPCVGFDMDWLENEIEKYPTEQIFICIHEMDSAESDYRLGKLVRENDRIVCFFRGHTHRSGTYTCENLQNKFLFDLGSYAYNGDNYRTFSPEFAWGYGVLEWNDTEANYYHVKYGRKYIGDNGEFDYVGAIEDKQTIEFKK